MVRSGAHARADRHDPHGTDTECAVSELHSPGDRHSSLIIFAKSIKMLQEIEKMKGRDFVQQLLDGTVLNEKHRKIVAQVTSELE